MADVRITAGSQPWAPVHPAARAEAVKAAQRAFFNTALTQTQAPSTTTSAVAAAPVPQPRATRLKATVVQDTVPSDRILRPGSLLDIRV